MVWLGSVFAVLIPAILGRFDRPLEPVLVLDRLQPVTVGADNLEVLGLVVVMVAVYVVNI